MVDLKRPIRIAKGDEDASRTMRVLTILALLTLGGLVPYVMIQAGPYGISSAGLAALFLYARRRGWVLRSN